jgi:hypothetical protein
MRNVSIAYGCIFGTLIVLTWMRYSSFSRKGAMFVTCAHVFGQISAYRNMDFLFDKLYPLFKKDLK